MFYKQILLYRKMMMSNFISSSFLPQFLLDYRMDTPRNTITEEQDVNLNWKTFDKKEIIYNEQYIELEKLKQRELECPICLNIITDNVIVTSCLHKFCSSCFTNHITSSQNPSCPMCRNHLDFHSFTISEDLSSLLQNSNVKCKNAECSLILPRKEYYDHINNCDYQKQQCLKCNTLVYKKNLNSHLNECVYRRVTCEKCNTTTTKFEMTDHLNEHCPFTKVKCPFEGCGTVQERHTIYHTHILACEFRTLDCMNKCGATMIYSKMDEHENVCINRKVECEKCLEIIYLSEFKTHLETCPKSRTKCLSCLEYFENNDLLQHTNICTERILSCPNGCEKEVKLKSLQEHNKMCSHRSILCQDCLHYYKFKDSSTHDIICPEKSVNCSRCGELYTRKRTFEHNLSCEFSYIECKYSYAGCSATLRRKDMNDHVQKNKDYHLELLERYILEHVHNSRDEEYDEASVDEVDEENDSDLHYSSNLLLSPEFQSQTLTHTIPPILTSMNFFNLISRPNSEEFFSE